MKPVPLITLAAAGLLLALPCAAADTLRCDGGVIGVGDSKATVLQKCGEPVAKDSYCEAVPTQTVVDPQTPSTVVNVPPCENVDSWTYNLGSGKLMNTLQFRKGALRSITDGDRAR